SVRHFANNVFILSPMSALTFTLIQTSLHWEDKASNLQMLEEKINSITEKTQVVVLPEMFSTGFSMNPELLAETMDGETISWMKRLAAAKKVILTGSVIIQENGSYYNRFVWMQPNGEFGYYNKRHLFAFAQEDKHYSPGTERFIASANGLKVLLMVCYDLRFPVWARQISPLTPQQKREDVDTKDVFEYDILIYVANWPERRSTAWKTLLQARAIENQCYVIGVNRVGDDGNAIYHSGDSMVVSPLGEVLYHKANDEDIFTITLKKEDLDDVRRKFQFWRDADDFQIMI
ncbi:MAG TPA: nitrilase family protein, partial [Flavisolibacter sp.]|nr:nitrilase family protein [Flavisolibacter sp.]